MCNLSHNGTDFNFNSNVKHSAFHHGTESVPSGSIAKLSSVSDVASANFYYPKLCPRHRVPSICSSETTSATGYRQRRPKRTRSYVSSDVASSVDLNEFKSSRSYSRRRKYFSLNEGSSSKLEQNSRRSLKSFTKLNLQDTKLKNSDMFDFKSKPNRVHFHLHDGESESDTEKLGNISSKDKFDKIYESNTMFENLDHLSKDMQTPNIVLINEDSNNNTDICSPAPIVTEPDICDTSDNYCKKDQKYPDNNNLDCDSYWDSY